MYVRTVEGRETTFGTSGSLWRDALVMYDRATESWWSQVNATAIAGAREGDVLRALPSVVTTWGAWRERHPDTLVLEKPRLDGSPYDRYYASAEAYGASGTGTKDARLPGKELVIGVRAGDETAAAPVTVLERQGVMNGEVGGVPVAWLALGDQGAAAFDRRLGDRQVVLRRAADGSFTADGNRFDPSTGVMATAGEGPRQLVRLPALRAYWYSWTSFHPHTLLVDGAD